VLILGKREWSWTGGRLPRGLLLEPDSDGLSVLEEHENGRLRGSTGFNKDGDLVGRVAILWTWDEDLLMSFVELEAIFPTCSILLWRLRLSSRANFLVQPEAVHLNFFSPVSAGDFSLEA